MRELLRTWDSGRGVAVGVLVLLGAAPAMGQTATGSVTREQAATSKVVGEAAEDPRRTEAGRVAEEEAAPQDEGKRYAPEGPVHTVTLAEAFAVGVYEVTRGEYERFVGATGHAAGNACAPRMKEEVWRCGPGGIGGSRGIGRVGSIRWCA